MRRLALAALAVALGGQSAHASSTPTLRFGRSGGNIAPFTVTISPTGRVTTQGPVKLARPSRTLTPDAVHGLVVLAKTEGFSRMPAATACRGTLPDFAGSFVEVGSKRVTVRGSCNRRFSQLYAVFAAAAGVR